MSMALEKEKIVIFVADDNLEHRKSLKENLKKVEINAKIRAFDNETKLMNSLGQPTVLPDIIFITASLENGDAINCLKRIRLKKKFQEVPVIIFSPCTYLKDIKDSFDCDASLFIPKPVFEKNSVKALQEIFRPRWRYHLLQPNSYKFVLAQDTLDADKLCWSAS
jgi:response regulator RpfG family c-di-GMP phosphodiesterase